MGAQAFLLSTGVVALAELGDKTQLLALVLATRFGRPLPILLGICLATVLNHLLAGALGVWLAGALSAGMLRWILGLGFVAMGAWLLVPDSADGATTRAARLGVFGATLVSFFIVEMGDKTQVATMALAARYASVLPVVAGSTLGILIANAPVVLLGKAISRWLPLRLVHVVVALLFAVLGVLALFGVGLPHDPGR